MPRAFLLVTALVCGALVMVIEVMGSRVIGPFFGVSLFVWTALITVTLVSLAAGYAAGGVISHRRGTPDVLYGIIAVAGLCALLVPVLREPVLRATVPLGLRAGALLASAILFGPALFLLGCVSPILVRIAVREVETAGRTAGLLSSVSTVGSFAGTVLTGFVLIAWLGVGRIFQVVGAALLLTAAAWFVGYRRRWLALLPLAAALALAAGAERPLASKLLANGTRLEELHRSDGFYGSVRVVDYSAGGLRVRDLVLDGQIQGGMEMGSGLSAYGYAYFMQYLPWAARPGGKTCLVVGLGAGLVARWFEAQGVRTDVVDINPDVVEVARRWFGLAVTGDVVVDDARHFLATTSRRYDYVVLDVFNGDTTPAHLLSREALALVAERLAPGGILAVNFVGSLDAGSLMTASVVRTLRAVFPAVTVHPVGDPGAGGGTVNLAFVATTGARLDFDPERVARFPIHRLAGDVRERLWRTWEPPPSAPALVLTDDYNPVDVLDVPLKEAARRNMLASTDWDVLL